MKSKQQTAETRVWIAMGIFLIIAIIGIAWEVHTTWGYDERTGQFDSAKQEAHYLDHLYGRSDDW